MHCRGPVAPDDVDGGVELTLDVRLPGHVWCEGGEVDGLHKWAAVSAAVCIAAAAVDKANLTNRAPFAAVEKDCCCVSQWWLALQA